MASDPSGGYADYPSLDGPPSGGDGFDSGGPPPLPPPATDVPF